jgi:hypothetical protein
MYSWGSNTTNWKKPGKYKFDSARKPYLDSLADDSADKGGRHYTRRDAPNMALVSPLNKRIRSESENPVVIAVDVTGSMASWPAEIFDRLPLLYQTLSQYMPDMEVCFAAIGDANSDEYPLQVNDFAKGVELEDKINALCAEGGGGGQVSESYELLGYFLKEHCELPKAKLPFLIIYGDEKFYPKVDPSQVRHYLGQTLESELDSAGVWRSLMQKFNLFYLHKPYGNEDDEGTTREVGKYWENIIGKERVIALPSCERAVDVAIAIMAKYAGHYGDFTANISARQDPDQIAAVADSVRFLPNDPDGPIVRASRLLGTGGGSKSKRLDEA